jgi:hypothetical protein
MSLENVAAEHHGVHGYAQSNAQHAGKLAG